MSVRGPHSSILRNFDFIAGPDQLFLLMQTRIRLPKLMRIRNLDFIRNLAGVDFSFVSSSYIEYIRSHIFVFVLLRYHRYVL